MAAAQVLQQMGGSESDLRWETQASLLGQGLQARAAKAALPVSQAAIAAQYRAEPQRWAHPSRRDLQVSLTPDATTAAQARQALRSGTSAVCRGHR